jgi:hypothetical protein
MEFLLTQTTYNTSHVFLTRGKRLFPTHQNYDISTATMQCAVTIVVVVIDNPLLQLHYYNVRDAF